MLGISWGRLVDVVRLVTKPLRGWSLSAGLLVMVLFVRPHLVLDRSLALPSLWSRRWCCRSARETSQKNRRLLPPSRGASFARISARRNFRAQTRREKSRNRVVGGSVGRTEIFFQQGISTRKCCAEIEPQEEPRGAAAAFRRRAGGVFPSFT